MDGWLERFSAFKPALETEERMREATFVMSMVEMRKSEALTGLASCSFFVCEKIKQQ
jgi:hypothetical protein